MATFVLVPGAMHGAWCWRQVKGLLEELGHGVRTPLMPGVGELADHLTPEIGVEDHVNAVVAACDGLSEITLVCHSYSGVLAGPVVERAGGRVTTALLAGAFIAYPGECLMDVEPPGTVAAWEELAAAEGDGWKIPFREAFLQRWGVDDPQIAQMLRERLTPFPLRCATDRIAYDPHALASVRRIWLDHDRPAGDALQLSRERAEADGWEIREIAATHDMMLVAPEATAGLFDAIAAGQ